MNARSLFHLGVYLAAPLLSAGCGPSADTPSTEGKGKASAATAITTVKPVRRTVSHKIEQPGEIQAFEQTPMYARLAGYVETVSKDIGDRVEQDEVLAELSVPEKEEEYQQKKALAEQAEAEVEQAKRLLDAAEAAVTNAGARLKEAESARLRAAAELRRAESQYERLKKTMGSISEEAIDETRLGFEASKANVAEVEARIKSTEAARIEAEARRDKARADVRVAEARLRVAQADARREAALLRYAKLRAPFPGVVIWRKVDPGHLLEPTASGAKGEPVFIVARTNPVRIFVDVPEDAAVLVKDGVQTVVSVEALKGEQFKAKVKRTAWALTPKDKERTLRTEIDVENPTDAENPNGRLRPGMYAYAAITVEHANVLALPVSAVVTHGEQIFCYRVEDGKAVRVPIKVGFRDDKFVEVVKKQKASKEGRWEDFTGEEEIIATGAAALTDGQAVSPAP
jgi:RND family efflux transporter MFP subunit